MRHRIRRSQGTLLGLSLLLVSTLASAQKLQVNSLGYFETQGFNVFVFNNEYNGFFFDEKTAGIELIHHGVRTATGGAVRLQPTPEQWDLVPVVVNRTVDAPHQTIEVALRYEQYHFDFKVSAVARDNGILLRVVLDKPVPDSLSGHTGFNLEFLPSAYFEKTYMADGVPGIFPLYPASRTEIRPVSEKIPQFAGHSTFDDRGRGEFILPDPLASGNTFVLAPEDPERRILIKSSLGAINLYDGRVLAQNGWFVVRTAIPAGKTGTVVEWYLEPSVVPGWKRKPVVEFSQVGYHPSQNKVAVVELDSHDTPLPTASILKVTDQGTMVEKLKADVKPWGKYTRYQYATVDFSSVRDQGLYVIQYGDQKTEAFPIAPTVYDNVWQPTLDVWFPVQMDHMEVNEAYRVWHGVPYRDDALQAPVNHQHFDWYKMGPTTDTKYKPFERIPGLAVGGWFDAGDFDIQTASHCEALLSFTDTWEQFHVTRDETFIDQTTRYVDIHRPDGKPDLLQQIEHGTLQVVAQLKNVGHPVRGIIVPNLHQYHHLGDASTVTDNLPYNPSLKPYQSDGVSSGTMDDRWVFTNRMAWMDYFSMGALAAAHRALLTYNKPLAEDALAEAVRLWKEDEAGGLPPDTSEEALMFGNIPKLMAALQLYISTKDQGYAERFKEMIWPALDQSLAFSIRPALQAVQYLDPAYKTRLRGYVVKYKQFLDTLAKDNPYGVPMMARNWGGDSPIITWAMGNYYAARNYPDVISPEYAYKGLTYLFGTHPYSNVSFVSTVGTKSKKITYGNNRADFRFIAGGVVPGILMLKPDFPENKEDWPFLWGENECVVDIGADYIFLANAVRDLVEHK